MRARYLGDAEISFFESWLDTGAVSQRPQDHLHSYVVALVLLV